jgi:hypothetical protein
MIDSRRIRRERHATRIGTRKNAYKVLVGKPEGKSPFGRRRSRCEDNVNSGVREIVFQWIDRIFSPDRDSNRIQF